MKNQAIWSVLAMVTIWLTIHTVKLNTIVPDYESMTNKINLLVHKLNELENPTEPIAHGAMILFAGALLLTPGFFTDTVGFLLLLPNVRKAAFFWLKNRLNLVKFSSSNGSSANKNKYPDIEVTDYKEVKPEEKSPWTNNSKTHSSE